MRRPRGSNRVSSTVLVLGILAAAAIVAALVLPVVEITVNGLPCEPAEVELAKDCRASGSVWLVPLAVLILVMTFGAGLGGSRAAGVALISAGVAVLGLALMLDLPDVGDTGAIGRNFESARAMAGPGLWAELAGGALAVLAGALRLLSGQSAGGTSSSADSAR